MIIATWYFYGMIPAFIIAILWCLMMNMIYEFSIQDIFLSLVISLLSWALVITVIVTPIICLFLKYFGSEEVKQDLAHDISIINSWKDTRYREREYREERRKKEAELLMSKSKKITKMNNASGVFDFVTN